MNVLKDRTPISVPSVPAKVSTVFASYPKRAQDVLLELRAMIFNIAADNPKIGPITETLKWGEAAYLTAQSKSGSTIRLGYKPATPQACAIYLNCNTNLVETMRELYPNSLVYQGNRAVLVSLDTPIPAAADHCLAMALSYHQNKKQSGE
jgi:hypothetical protein